MQQNWTTKSLLDKCFESNRRFTLIDNFQTMSRIIYKARPWKIKLYNAGSAAAFAPSLVFAGQLISGLDFHLNNDLVVLILWFLVMVPIINSSRVVSKSKSRFPRNCDWRLYVFEPDFCFGSFTSIRSQNGNQQGKLRNHPHVATFTYNSENYNWYQHIEIPWPLQILDKFSSKEWKRQN